MCIYILCVFYVVLNQLVLPMQFENLIKLVCVHCTTALLDVHLTPQDHITLNTDIENYNES